MHQHEKYMQRCIDLAKNGSGLVSPNPLVGAVIVHNNVIIGEGWHRKAGTPHAEVHAINSVRDKSLLKKSAIYVSLEPCSHFGKTPPCSDLIIRYGIPKVVIGSVDPNPQVAGRGLAKLENAGIEVQQGVLEEQCTDINKMFFTAHQKKRPFITLKWARTADGFIDKWRADAESGQLKISGAETKVAVHKWRTEHDAILIGTNTALNDNPKLDSRWYGGKNPIRLIIDRKNRLPQHLNVFTDGQPTIKFSQMPSTANLPYKHIQVDEPDFLQGVIHSLLEMGIQSVFVEGGTGILNAFIKANLWDEIIEISAPLQLGKGLPAPSYKGKQISQCTLGLDVLKKFKNA